MSRPTERSSKLALPPLGRGISRRETHIMNPLRLFVEKTASRLFSRSDGPEVNQQCSSFFTAYWSESGDSSTAPVETPPPSPQTTLTCSTNVLLPWPMEESVALAGAFPDGSGTVLGVNVNVKDESFCNQGSEGHHLFHHQLSGS